MSVCLFVLINAKTAEPIGPKFYVGPHMILGKFKDAQNLKNLSSKMLILIKFNPQIFLLLFHRIENSERLSYN